MDIKTNTNPTSPVLPNFLIVGVGKCGTTTLYYLLKEHPDIFMSQVKEPCFFSAQGLTFPQNGIEDNRKHFVRDFDDYRHLFADWNNQKAIGEASADTIYYYPQTIPFIQKILGDPRIIIMLRNPVDRAYSNYMHLLRDGREPLTFEEALAQEDERIQNNWQTMWHYTRQDMYYHQVKAFLEAFSHVHVLFTDQLKKEPQLTLKKVFQFLEVDENFKTSHVSKHYNVSGVPRFKAINQLFLMKNIFQRTICRVGFFLLSEDRYCKFRDSCRAKFFRRVEMKKETRASLQNLYCEDILRLQDLLGRDLSHWRK